MTDLKAIGFVVYTYEALEQRSNEIIAWLNNIEEWAGHSFTDYNFVPRGKGSGRLIKLSNKTYNAFTKKISNEKPWSVISVGWPERGLLNFPSKSMGFQVTIKSLMPAWEGGERFRSPSYLAVIIHPEILENSKEGINGFIKLCKEAWSVSRSIYGFIDIETEISLGDNLFRNFDRQMNNLIPTEHINEFRKWQEIGPELNRKAWKAFWGNLFGKDHLQQLGGLPNLRKADPFTSFEELSSIAYKNGIEKIKSCKCFYEIEDIAQNGILVTLTETPFNWNQPIAQDQKERFQQIIQPIAIG